MGNLAKLAVTPRVHRAVAGVGLRLDEQRRHAWMAFAYLGLHRNDASLDVVGALVIRKFDAEGRNDFGRRQLHRQKAVGPEHAGRTSCDVEDRSRKFRIGRLAELQKYSSRP